MSKNQKITCPCCGFMAFDGQPGSFEICDFCGWEDDAKQLSNPCSGGGANSESLSEAQDAFCDTIPGADLDEWISGGSERDSQWRPLNNVEKDLFRRDVTDHGLWKNKVASDLSQAYWNRNIVAERTL